MKRLFTTILLVALTLSAWAQGSVLDELKADPKKAYGNDFPYNYPAGELTKAPRGYKPFYITTYARHGSRYYWNDQLYKTLDTLLNTAHEKQLLTAEGEAFYNKFEDAKEELMTGISELSQLGWDQHQQIATTMYKRFKPIFKKGGDILAVSSLEGRCVLSMASFCEQLTQCNPKLEIREQSSRFTLSAVVPDDAKNPKLERFIKPRPRYEKNRSQFVYKQDNLNQRIIERVFTSTEGLPGNMNSIASSLISLYTSLPNIGHEGMMGNIITDDEIVARWESSNLGSYSWVFSGIYNVIPILEDMVTKADEAIAGTNKRVADLRFGHDTYIGPLTVLMGLNGANTDPEDPNEVKNIYQNWQTCKASNIQLVFYHSRKASKPVLVKCLLNGQEVTLPVETDSYPYYKWSDLREYYIARFAEGRAASKDL